MVRGAAVKNALKINHLVLKANSIVTWRPAVGSASPQTLGRMTALLRILFALLLAGPAVALPQARMLPVDEAASVPDFFSFRAQLQIAVAKRDIEAIVSVLDKDVKLSFGGDAGVEDFKRMWKPSAPDSGLWEALAAVLSLGGTFAPDGTFTAPYVFTKWPREKDAFTHIAAIGAGVRVRSFPSAASPVVGTLDCSIVELVESSAVETKWVQVRVGPGRTGFADSRFLRSPIDYRINFAKLDGRWRVVFFLAGD